MFQHKAQDVLHVLLVVLGMDLVAVPDQVHVVTRDQEITGVLALQIQIHFISLDAVNVELLVSKVGQ